MSPLDYRIVADHRRKGDMIDFDAGAVVGLQLAFTLLFVNRGRTLHGVIQDAKGYDRAETRTRFGCLLRSRPLGSCSERSLDTPTSPESIVERCPRYA